VLQAPFVGDVPCFAGAGRQVHPEHPAGKAVKAPREGHGIH
jgi:hypothetical protein